MLYIGDKVFYPSFGAGVVINIEEREIYGDINKYYIIRLLNDIVTMVPVKNSESKCIRLCLDKDECIEALDIFMSRGVSIDGKWLDRYKVYTRAIKHGDLFDMCYVLNGIIALKDVKKISKSEEKFLNDILDMVSEEICLVLNIEIENVKMLIVTGEKLV
ncbi:MAG: CarD family transcriptional regulator [Clostridium sp.]